jgi:3-hydroxyisobutyrate dehydrogenase
MNALSRSCRKYGQAAQRLMSTKIGFIGLGNMGFSMAENLLKSNQLKKEFVMVYDINADSSKKLADKGAKVASSVKELAASCNVIVTMLPATAHVCGVMRGDNGIFKNAPAGALIIDSSTIDPLASKDLHAEAESHKMHMVDAPVSGGVTGAAAGTLTFMVGGSEQNLERSREFLAAMGKNIVHCGGAGAGGITKLCNNLALAISMIGTSEAMALGVRLGMDPKKLAGVMNTSTARCWSSDAYNPVPGVMANVPSSREYSGGFGSALMEKDLSLAMDAAQKVKARLPLGAQAHQVSFLFLTKSRYYCLVLLLLLPVSCFSPLWLSFW